MKKKYYLIAVVALIIMVGILVYQQKSQTVLTDFSKTNQISIKELDENDLTGIRCYWGENKEKGVKLTKNDKDNQWEVSSYYSAPADKEKIKRIVTQVNELNGEPRSSSAEVLSQFRLEDKEAMHLAFLGKGEKELFHLLIGKRAPGYGEGFVRISGRNEVYLADKDYRYLIGLYNDNNQDPVSKDWADLQFVNIEDTNAVKKMFLAEYGRNKVILVRVETKKEIKEEEEKEEKNKGKQADQAELKKSKPFVKVISWDLIQPKRDKKPDKKIVDSVLGGLKRLRAAEIIDPDKAKDLKAFGLENPKYQLSIFSDGGDVTRLSFGKKDKNYYVMAVGGKYLYRINERGYDQTFVKIAGFAQEEKKSPPKTVSQTSKKVRKATSAPKPKKKSAVKDSIKKAVKKAKPKVSAQPPEVRQKATSAPKTEKKKPVNLDSGKKTDKKALQKPVF